MNNLMLNKKSIELDNIKMWDFPDFCDAFIIYAEYENGQKLTEAELDELSQDSALMNELIHERIY